MKPAVRILAFLLACTLCASSFAQEFVPLEQLQHQAQQQAARAPWIKRNALPLAAAAAVGGGLFVRHWVRQQKKLKLQILELEEELRNHRLVNQRLLEYQETLSDELDKAQSRAAQAESTLEHLRQGKTVSPREPLPPAQRFAPFARTDVSKQLLSENSALFKNMPSTEVKALLHQVDEVAAQTPRQALYSLNHLTRQAAGDIARLQVFIAAGKYIKLSVVLVLLNVLIPSQKASGQEPLLRLRQNPALFLEATPQQLQAWEQDPQAYALCRQIADAIDQAASLELTEQEANSLVKIAAEEAAARQIQLNASLRNSLAR